MGKTSQRRATQIQENNVGCTWGLIRMFYSRRDPKLILDRKQGSRRHSFSGFAGTMQNSKPNGVASPDAGIGIASSSGSFDPGGSNLN